jgi:hypothetical protein
MAKKRKQRSPTVASETQAAVRSPTAPETHAAAGGHDGHSLLHHHFDDLDQQRECTSLAMWLFLGTEIMMFGGLFFS